MSLYFENISFNYGATEVLRGIHLRANTGDITCLLGGSGSGKSTLLRLAAGMERVQQGRILLEDTELASRTSHPPPEQRPVGMMFQESALFPHMTIADNIAFGLAHLSKAERRDTVKRMLELVDMAGYERRYPHSLSGGQQQRAALARSLAPCPKVLLMDEPYANIDISLRRSLREAARLILKQNDTATILVTHDAQEAAEMADSIALLHEGGVVQQGAPDELYLAPNCAVVASLYGEAQIIQGQVVGGGFDTPWGSIHAHTELPAGTQVDLAIRPRGIIPTVEAGAACKIVDRRFVSGLAQLSLQPEASSQLLRVAAPQGNFNPGDRVSLQAQNKDFFVYER